tara:strand:+ start:5944 stop:6276 length:333 start_codon:yes stop_codon:yes gene_type:complete
MIGKKKSKVQDSGPVKFKYNEPQILQELEDYIESTYGQHYVDVKRDIQIQDVFDSISIAEEFCRGAAIKYLIRFGKKDGKNSKDLMKAMHYMVLLYHYAFKTIKDGNEIK